MPDPLQRITAILREHPCCVKSGHEDALATVLVDALGLTQQWGSVVGLQEPTGHPQGEQYARKYVAKFLEMRGAPYMDYVVSRWVTRWERVDD